MRFAIALKGLAKVTCLRRQVDIAIDFGYTILVHRTPLPFPL
jgi:hypothetical protein